MKEYEYIRESIKKLLKPSRFQHSLNVEEAAVELAKIYGADVSKCRIAAIAHDCVKNLTDPELIDMAMEYGLEVDEIQLNFPQLLHGSVGAKYCEQVFKIKDEEILNAICFHTTGRRNMTTLEKIVYLADVIEKGRDFPGIEKIRELSKINLNKALILACNTTIEYILKKDFLLHPLTIEFRNSLLMEGEI
ncbi:phosphohydrolase [Fervidicella metallireducens AeB]|uniref:bis(5'-nucleosyl)-tetraphosphatase (symmetrical) n=1 Tax=Fervidicella metallireducens AeB TaxID=1403537 RepID=A0A017RUN6_9CLOT|nr:bis(5'-nucleosyl)-tetraphosphatase (symmetrical) YqeK [Fervidicella metallireducens]EYE88478.1 phosphohydrolase [Fervidicella metallireducens AeB]